MPQPPNSVNPSSRDGRGRREPSRDQQEDDLIGRDLEDRHATPRRYDEDDSSDPTMPSDESALNTKI
jgi:hypothetical protein